LKLNNNLAQKMLDLWWEKAYINSMKHKCAEIGGWIGMVLIHGATIPTSIAVIMGWSDHVPPLDMVLMIWTGLILFFFRALARFDWLYLISNGAGLVIQSVLLGVILWMT
jgi:hypothetical protein